MALAVSDNGNNDPRKTLAPEGAVNIPAVELSGVNVSVGLHPGDPSKKMILIGPVMLVLPFDPDAARTIARGLTGIEIASAGQLPPRPPDILH